MEWILSYFPAYMLVFCRVTSFFLVAPIFSARNVPAQLKLGLSFFIALIAFSGAGAEAGVVLDGLYILAIVREILVGLCLGFIAYLFFTVVQIAGAFIDIQMGFGIANVIDPMTGMQSPVIGNLKFMIATLLFLTLNGHLYLLEAIMRSYEWVPLSNDLFARMYGGQISDFIVKTFSEVFALSFQMAAPLVVAMFLTDVGLGLLARVSPQFNIFVIGLPLKILLGLLMLVLLFPGYEQLFIHIFAEMMDTTKSFFGLFQNG
ncbi:flagellar biosynthetic protein FliR [Paenibacillus sp. UNCCL117]|uniref:flagellar biosynthetic protein FliR n=1 Tax=unclassified Paenibacillus TaxID=185978 RepID=UPI000888F8D6|nr:MULTISPECIES: flagellar biosynthetic protein FliR [unclassified Paenibacillus]SDC86656.1 flagellar biosynthetic protein FliR [Paenibacillus sp. cl123]SFW27866.1 flagellar biosynthetic protein FliR [Paenibacillus sp. UNCCL117]